jgi:hypothetical protein
MQQHFAFQGPPNFNKIGIFGFKTNHLATLFPIAEDYLIRASAL